MSLLVDRLVYPIQQVRETHLCLKILLLHQNLLKHFPNKLLQGYHFLDFHVVKRLLKVDHVNDTVRLTITRDHGQEQKVANFVHCLDVVDLLHERGRALELIVVDRLVLREDCACYTQVIRHLDHLVLVHEEVPHLHLVVEFLLHCLDSVVHSFDLGTILPTIHA